MIPNLRERRFTKLVNRLIILISRINRPYNVSKLKVILV